MDMKDIEKMAKGANINLKDIDKMAKSAGIDDKKSAELLGMLGQVDQAQMAQIMAMLSAIDVKSLDINALSKQFGIPAESIQQFLKMIQK